MTYELTDSKTSLTSKQNSPTSITYLPPNPTPTRRVNNSPTKSLVIETYTFLGRRYLTFNNRDYIPWEFVRYQLYGLCDKMSGYYDTINLREVL